MSAIAPCGHAGPVDVCPACATERGRAADPLAAADRCGEQIARLTADRDDARRQLGEAIALLRRVEDAWLDLYEPGGHEAHDAAIDAIAEFLRRLTIPAAEAATTGDPK